MKRVATLAGLAAVLVVSGTVAAQQRSRDGRLSGECRRAVVSLCGLSGGRTGIRICLREKYAQLPEPCTTEILTIADRRANANAAVPPGARELSFGTDPRQRLDFWPSAGRATSAPLVVFIHGGGWAIGDKRTSTGAKSTYFPARGYAFASLNYRLVPAVTPAEQAQDIADALALLRRDAAALGIDSDRIVLMGHSAGAHLAALVGTDPRFLTTAGVPAAAVRGVVLLDGAGYDVARQMQSRAPLVGAMYSAAFGTDPATQRALSPITHVASPNAARWLIVNDTGRADSELQAGLLTDALDRAGTQVERLRLSNTSHMLINRNVGMDGDAQTARIAEFLTSAFR